MAAILKNDWAGQLADEFSKPYYLELRAFLIEEYRRGIVYPDMHDIFNALHYTVLQRDQGVHPRTRSLPWAGPGPRP